MGELQRKLRAAEEAAAEERRKVDAIQADAATAWAKVEALREAADDLNKLLAVERKGRKEDMRNAEILLAEYDGVAGKASPPPSDPRDPHVPALQQRPIQPVRDEARGVGPAATSTNGDFRGTRSRRDVARDAARTAAQALAKDAIKGVYEVARPRLHDMASFDDAALGGLLVHIGGFLSEANTRARVKLTQAGLQEVIKVLEVVDFLDDTLSVIIAEGINRIPSPRPKDPLAVGFARRMRGSSSDMVCVACGIDLEEKGRRHPFSRSLDVRGAYFDGQPTSCPFIKRRCRTCKELRDSVHRDFPVKGADPCHGRALCPLQNPQSISSLGVYLELRGKNALSPVKVGGPKRIQANGHGSDHRKRVHFDFV